jgi:aspartate/methionine/tyrosine aminotransferase
VADEVYEKLIYDGHEHISFASLPGMRERTITVNSLSKTYAMTGWRIGYIAAEKSLVQEFLKISQYSITNVAPFIQMAAVVALTNQEVQLFVEVMRNIYNKRRLLIIDQLKGFEGICAVIPQGAFYFMIDISHFCQNSTLFSTRFLEKEQVGVIPGVSFGTCAEGFIRLTFAASEVDIMEGISRLHRFLQTEFATR